MKTLEELARDNFTLFTLKKLGKKCDWNLLDSQRKLDWMDEVYFNITEALTEIEKRLDNKQLDRVPQASYEAGVVHGTNREQLRVKREIKNIRDKFKEDLTEFIEKNS